MQNLHANIEWPAGSRAEQKYFLNLYCRTISTIPISNGSVIFRSKHANKQATKSSHKIDGYLKNFV